MTGSTEKFHKYFKMVTEDAIEVIEHNNGDQSIWEIEGPSGHFGYITAKMKGEEVEKWSFHLGTNIELLKQTGDWPPRTQDNE